MSFDRPGVYVQETLNPVQTIAAPTSATFAAFYGANDKGPLTPVLVSSWSEYTKYFGTWNTAAGNELPLAVYTFFQNGGSRAYVARAVGAGAVSAFRALNDRAGTPAPTLRIQAFNAGTWGNNLNVTITDSTTTGLFNITLYQGGNTDADIVETFTDLSMTSTNARYALSVINATSNYVFALDLGSAATGAVRNPATGTNLSLATGANGGAITNITTYTPFDIINQSLTLNVAGRVDATTVNAAISYAEARGDIFVVIDGSDLPVGNAATSSTQLNLASTYTPSSAAAVYYPRISISDPTVGVNGSSTAVRTIGAGGAVAGLYSATDAARGVFKAPAGLQARIAGAVGVSSLTNAELDLMNSTAAPVNAIKFIPGTGICVMGARTLKAGNLDKYVPTRRTLIFLKKTLTELTQFAVFEPNNAETRRRLNSTISSFLTSFWSQGGLAGATPQQAFFVQADTENNPQVSIDNGELNIAVGVALQRPAEFIVIKIGQFDGGTTVTVA
jgi:hypothetical protein